MVFELSNMEVQHSTDHLIGVATFWVGNMNVKHCIDYLMMIVVMVQQGNLSGEHSIDSWVLVLVLAPVLLAADVAVAAMVQGNMKHLDMQNSNYYYMEEAGQMISRIETRLGASHFEEHIGSQQEVEGEVEEVLLCL